MCYLHVKARLPFFVINLFPVTVKQLGCKDLFPLLHVKMCKSNNILNITFRLRIITLKMEERENYCYIINFPLYYLIFPILWLASLNTAGRRRT